MQSSSSFPSWSQGWSPCWSPDGSRAAAELQRLSPVVSTTHPSLAGNACSQHQQRLLCGYLQLHAELSDPSCCVFPCKQSLSLLALLPHRGRRKHHHNRSLKLPKTFAKHPVYYSPWFFSCCRCFQSLSSSHTLPRAANTFLIFTSQSLSDAFLPFIGLCFAFTSKSSQLNSLSGLFFFHLSFFLAYG